METLNREQRRAIAKAKPPKGKHHQRGFVQLPITMQFSAQDETALMLQPVQCLDRMLAGTADESDWHALALRLNWGRLLNKAYFTEKESFFIDAQADLRAIKERGDWRVSEDEHGRMNAALILANQMQKQCTRRELRQSIEAVYEANEYHQKLERIKDSFN